MSNIIDQIYADATAKHKEESTSHTCPVTGSDLFVGLEDVGETALAAYKATVPEDQFMREVIASDYIFSSPVSAISRQCLIAAVRKTLA